MKKTISLALAVLFALLTLAGCVNKDEPSEKTAMYTKNFSVTKPMLTYSFNSQYLNFITDNEENLDSYGLDTTQPLDKQNCLLNNANWYDYFMDNAKERLEQCLIIAEKAKAEGKTLSKDDEAEIQNELNVLKEAAKEQKKTLADYLEAYFGEGVTNNVVLSVLRMEKMVDKYYIKYEKTIDTSVEAVEKYYNGHKKLYSSVDYLSFYITPFSNSMKDSADAKETAMMLSEAEDSEAFLELVEDYLTDYYTNHYGVELSKKKIEKKVEKATLSCEVKGAVYDANSEISRWAFSDDRELYDGTIIEDAESDGFYVYFLSSLPYREEYNAVTIRQIVYDVSKFATEDDALQSAQEAILNLELNNYSKEYFEKLAADVTSKNFGGLYKNLTKGKLADAPELEEWIFSEKRKQGDITLLGTDSYGYHVIYIEEIGEPVWMLRSREGMLTSRFKEYVSKLSEEYPLGNNNNIIYSIAEIKLQK